MEKQALHKIIDCPLIETERLTLRLFEAADLDTAYKLFNDADVQKFLSARNKRSREQMEVLIKIPLIIGKPAVSECYASPTNNRMK